jgi:hypothetical protein
VNWRRIDAARGLNRATVSKRDVMVTVFSCNAFFILIFVFGRRQAAVSASSDQPVTILKRIKSSAHTASDAAACKTYKTNRTRT